MYVSFKPQNVAELSALHFCLIFLNDWMEDNLLQYLSWLECDSDESLGSLSSLINPTLQNLGFSMD